MILELVAFPILVSSFARNWKRTAGYNETLRTSLVCMIPSRKRGISLEMAKALGDAFDGNPEFFANLQESYEMATAKDPDPGVARWAM